MIQRTFLVILLCAFAGCLYIPGGDESEDSPDMLTLEMLFNYVDRCSQPTSLFFGGNCSYAKSNEMVYNSDTSTFLTGSTFSGHPNLECRYPGSTHISSASYNKWFLSETEDPPQGYAPRFLFEHKTIYAGGYDAGVTQFTSYSSGDILICLCDSMYGCTADHKNTGTYQIITAQ